MPPKLFAGLTAGLLFASSAYAVEIAVLPVGLSLGAGHGRGAITVTNRGAEAVAMQVEAVSWTQTDGRDHYAPTRDLLVNPPLFTLGPGRAQVLRVGLRQPPSGERELAYRLFLREVPPPAAPPPDQASGGSRVRVLLELRLPVYVEPARIVRESHWQGQRSTDGAIEVTVANNGNVHMTVGELTLRAADAAADSPPLAAVKNNAAVFPGQQRSWALRPQAAAPGRRFMLNVATDQGPRDVALDLGRP
ncbi:MAG: fimbria/pilus periplasmic chaperone [Candidatus Nitricoxidivorans perseverans]|uniref:Fimbria/pilus periplasmic chaperone n=1 Tax=Candidatus Nitricoxidivorans perseverans TaxID=2975601 RepID=A0AA49FM45_9PROT|nr:MAG: fimbria/pilus periplasmic chaperone [Candidatus Nitricoxidivorans perseverans]